MMRITRTVLFISILGMVAARAQDPFIGEIRMFAGNFAPRGWAFCDGSVLSISQNTALFALLGTTYGGNGTTTFALPDLRGRVPLHAGKGTGLSDRPLGSSGGSETVTLTLPQVPAHSHTAQLAVDTTIATSDAPRGKLPARNASATPAYGNTSNSTASAGAVTVSPAGGGQPHENMPPFLAINYIIALQGIFPSRE